ncbi:arsenate reductase (glutaredoxin) [Thiomicrorhabdus cannonii]|uniref:arsenate reductase (glutaredoxin) n=1 Tax=Thiomicrorhabdus cannonii TaxID=2748011 RepID=UPI0015C0C8F1|nr:arsenate reductase (glutaredoxin) [Thiomicrorhabdus cannonii]
MTQATIYHNPRCSKSRETFKLLEARGVQVNEVRYLETPPSRPELKQLCEMLNLKPLQIIRTKETLFKELGLSTQDDRDDEAWLSILAEHPQLIERPIVVIGKRAAIGRPPENILALLQ